MKTHMTLAVAALGLMLTATAVSAQTRKAPQSPDSRHPQQLGQRLREGVQSGQLTRGELARLRQRMATFKQRATAMGSDKTPEQRRALLRERRQLSQMIFRLRHNRTHR